MIDKNTSRLERLNSVIESLQTVAKAGNAYKSNPAFSKVLKGATSMLACMSDVTNEFFAADGKVDDFDEDIDGYEMMVKKLRRQLPNDVDLLEDDHRQQRQKRLSEEQSYLFAQGFHDLAATVAIVRERERTYAFLKALWDGKQEKAKSLGCSAGQFTYGSSMMSLWRTATRHKTWVRVQAKAGARQRKGGKPMQSVVLGSSQGLLAAYLCHCFWADHEAAASPPPPSSSSRSCDTSLIVYGYEVLSCLHTTAQEVATCVSESIGNYACAVPVLADMFSADLSSADAVILTSLCWDEPTRRRMAWKLARELPRGAVVVDFTADTFDLVGLEMDSLGRRRRLVPPASSEPWSLTSTMTKQHGELEPRRFRLEGFVEGPVSWSEEQALAFFVAL